MSSSGVNIYPKNFEGTGFYAVKKDVLESNVPLKIFSVEGDVKLYAPLFQFSESLNGSESSDTEVNGMETSKKAIHLTEKYIIGPAKSLNYSEVKLPEESRHQISTEINPEFRESYEGRPDVDFGTLVVDEAFSLRRTGAHRVREGTYLVSQEGEIHNLNDLFDASLMLSFRVYQRAGETDLEKFIHRSGTEDQRNVQAIYELNESLKFSHLEKTTISEFTRSSVFFLEKESEAMPLFDIFSYHPVADFA